MKRMDAPNYNQLDVFRECAGAASTDAERQKYALHERDFGFGITAYEASSRAKAWYALPRSSWGNPTQIVCGTLSKAEATALYDRYMVGTTGPSRDVYDSIKVASGGKCPCCGGIGQVQTLDHYLPKSYFPLHAINPHNLIPSCRDCNTGKHATFPTTAEQQSIHPYFDAAHFFEERWVVASVVIGDPVTVHFSANPPLHWSPIDRSRAVSHFNGNSLPLRYAIQSSEMLSTIVVWRQGMLRALSPAEFSDHLREAADNPELPLNGWQRSLYSGLANSEWFCTNPFAP